jgi:hypothetical protein
VKIVEDRVVINEEPLEDSIYISRLSNFFRSATLNIFVLAGITREFIFVANTAVHVLSEDTQVFPHIQYGKVVWIQSRQEEVNRPMRGRSTDEEERSAEEESGRLRSAIF